MATGGRRVGQGSGLDWRSVLIEPREPSRLVTLLPLGGAPIEPRRVAIGSDFYISIQLLSFHYPFKRQWGTDFNPVVACEVEWRGAKGKPETSVALVNEAAIGGSAPGGATSFQGATLFGPVPMNRFLRMRMGLYAHKSNAKARLVTEGLRRGAGAVLTANGVLVGEAVSDGFFTMVKAMFEDSSSPCYASLQRELPPPGQSVFESGVWAVISATAKDRDLDGARLNDRGRLVDRSGKVIKNPHFVFAIGAQTHEEAPMAVEEIAALRDELHDKILADGAIDAEEFDAAFQMLRARVALSNKLTPADRRRVEAEIAMMQHDIKQLLHAGPAAAGSDLHTRVDARFMQVAPTVVAPRPDDVGQLKQRALEAAAKGQHAILATDTEAPRIALEAQDELREALDELIGLAIDAPQEMIPQAIALAAALRKQRQHVAMVDFVVALRDARVIDSELLYFGALGAMDSNRVDLAEALVMTALPLARADFDRVIQDSGASTKQRSDRLRVLMDAHALTGRLAKTRLASLSPRHKDLDDVLKRATDGYLASWQIGKAHLDLSPDLDYPIVNLFAIIHAAEKRKARKYGRKGAFVRDLRLEVEARRIIAETGDASDHANEKWDYVFANAGEANLFLEGSNSRAAAACFSRFLEGKNSDPFKLNTARRQLLELWDVPIDGASELSEIVRQMTALSATGPDSVTLSLKEVSHILSESGQQSVRQARFDGAAGTPVEKLQQITALSRSVGIVRRPDGSAVGTGFLIRGRLLHASLGDGFVFVTNDHVISAEIDYGHHVRPNQARIFFDREDDDDTYYTVSEVIWRSHADAHDCVVLRLDQPLPDIPKEITLCDQLPPLWLESAQIDPKLATERASRVHIIGHPSGRPLEVTFEHHFFVDHDGPEDGRSLPDPVAPVNVHYRAPTESGSSGSPVFDAGSLTLVALHNSVSQRPLRHRTGRGSRSYKANQGKWIRAICAAMAQDLAGRPKGG